MVNVFIFFYLKIIPISMLIFLFTSLISSRALMCWTGYQSQESIAKKCINDSLDEIVKLTNQKDTWFDSLKEMESFIQTCRRNGNTVKSVKTIQTRFKALEYCFNNLERRITNLLKVLAKNVYFSCKKQEEEYFWLLDKIEEYIESILDLLPYFEVKNKKIVLYEKGFKLSNYKFYKNLEGKTVYCSEIERKLINFFDFLEYCNRFFVKIELSF